MGEIRDTFSEFKVYWLMYMFICWCKDSILHIPWNKIRIFTSCFISSSPYVDDNHCQKIYKIKVKQSFVDRTWEVLYTHYSDTILIAMASQITGISIVYWTPCSGKYERKYQRSISLAFMRGIHRWPVNSLNKRPVMRKMFPFDDVIMIFHFCPEKQEVTP